jgi:GTP pyrophosphokinase
MELKKEVNKKFKSLLNIASPYIDSDDREKLNEAYKYACEIYGDSRSSSSEFRICHAIALARIAVEDLGLGVVSMVSCLLHDALVYDLATKEEIHKRFGGSVADIVSGFARLSDLPTDKVSIQSENFRKLFLAIINDIRIILLKIVHRLNDMRNLDKLNMASRKKFTAEVAHIYIPIAHRLGLYNIKKELEDLLMRYEHPETYQRIAREIRETETRRNAFINSFAAPIQKLLNEHGFRFEVKGRPKSIPSIWNKMQQQDVDFEEVYDLFAIRIIIDSTEDQEKADCWRVYSLVTNIYSPNPKRLRDWISSPKASGYESLHTTVKGPDNRWVEVQIRSKRMDEVAEKGQAAHWRYKEFGSREDSEKWISQVRDILENPKQIDFDDISATGKDRENESVFVFTPNGDLKELRTGSTVLDFAFEVHSNVGYSCTGAKVNEKIVNLKQELRNGDKVEILTSKVQKPKLDWLNYVVSSKAKNKIKRALKEEKFLEADKGNEILRRKFRNWKIPFSDNNIDKIIKKYKLKSSIDLYSLVYQGKIDLLEIKRLLQSEEKEQAGAPDKQGQPVEDEEKFRPKSHPGDVLRISRNLDKVNYNLAKCCNPIPGDPVFGFVTISRGITIHRKNCPNASQLLERYGYRMIPVEWKDTEDASTFTTTIKLSGVDKVGMMNEISEIISKDMKVNMLSVKIDSGDGEFNGIIKLIVRNTKHLDELLHKLEKIKGINRAIRIG